MVFFGTVSLFFFLMGFLFRFFLGFIVERDGIRGRGSSFRCRLVIWVLGLWIVLTCFRSELGFV